MKNSFYYLIFILLRYLFEKENKVSIFNRIMTYKQPWHFKEWCRHLSKNVFYPKTISLTRVTSRDFKVMNRRRPQDGGPEDHDDVAVRLTSRKVVELSEVYFIPVTRFSRDYLELGNERFSRLAPTATPCRGKKLPFCHSNRKRTSRKRRAQVAGCMSHIMYFLGRKIVRHAIPILRSKAFSI